MGVGNLRTPDDKPCLSQGFFSPRSSVGFSIDGKNWSKSRDGLPLLPLLSPHSCLPACLPLGSPLVSPLVLARPLRLVSPLSPLAALLGVCLKMIAAVAVSRFLPSLSSSSCRSRSSRVGQCVCFGLTDPFLYSPSVH